MAQNDEKVYGSSGAKLEAIFDAGTFVELGAYTKRPDSQTEFESVVCGYGAVGGALAFAFVQDSGRTKGAFGERHARKIADMYSLAVKNGAPVIAVFDSAGAVVFDGASALAAYGRFMKTVSDASGIVPQIAVVDGVCGGSSAVAASMFDIVVTIKDKSEFYVNAPFTVGEAAGKPDFAAANGISAYNAENEADAFAFVRSLIEVLPQNNSDSIYVDTADTLNRALAFDPAAYNADELCRALADEGRFARLYKDYTDKACLGITSIGGAVCGVIALKGTLDIKVARASAKLISFCDAFAIPVVTLVDSEGLDVSMDAESSAYASELARLAYAYTSSSNAKVTVVVGKAYGASFTLMGSKSVGADLAYALEDACISVLSPEASVAFVWNDKVGEKSREELENEWKEKCASAAEAADVGEIDDVIEASELRKRICAGLQMLASKAEGVPTRRHANMPL